MAGAVREPGWYPDQNDAGYNRYWNGRAWTARRHPVGAPPPSSERPRSAGRPLLGTSDPPVEARGRPPIWMWVIVALLLMRTALSLVAAFHHTAPDTPTAVPSRPAAVAPAQAASH